MEAVRPGLVLTSEPDEAAYPAILHPLVALNVSKVGDHERTPLGVLIQDPLTGQVTGGLWGRTSWKWLTIELLFVPEVYRGQGLGSAVMQLAEKEAIRRGCIGAWLDTHSFQAPGFYEKQGFERFGLIDDYPPGHSRIFFRKHF
ncbi:GNAT family N-acetyltransferase [Pseudoroseomonas wenyumeiae]|uniref:GNAT family N-acetyltransferase n=1 Tax=Teichococcus wenyumeiae TaxID=2478470 RepID=A0A3A9JDH0_9PROT|nr:GNAT family N-acetyltransferase [Pseudoroseomonas wenyumeiae]RKK01676.1 GNAT family N-acetyltransferase [Pseudoroseomonas wenyumeiae]RMI15135.1 GNAT family N-acetyltransferase [Pseudoroseomonas wenyumeiae]